MNDTSPTASSADPIVCRPTSWFKFRALVMFAMFAVFAGWFYLDATTGYRKKNQVFYLHKTFETASKEFSKQNENGDLTAEEWKAYAAGQTVAFPEDAEKILPAGVELPMQWPEILHDYERMKPLHWKELWEEYSGEKGLDADAPEQPYPSNKIREQWIVFWICLALALAALFFLLRTMGRSIRADGETLTSASGKRVPYRDLRTLDLRKWDTKGLAFLDYEGESGKGRIRLDGLTYGGFKKEDGEPAERLMRKIRANFSGEILEYAPVAQVTENEESKTGKNP
ncbi:MAG TPA: hypothetical protein VLO11_11790 [Luteolibacter sp.]|nr:hypothetical protein [Luteolibacter sp.]